MIDLSKNTNPYYPQKNMISYLKKNIINIEKYSERHVKIKNSYFLKTYHLDESNIVVNNGTLDAMNLILSLSKYKKIGYFSPTFWGIKVLAKKNNYKIIEEKLEQKQYYDIKKIDDLAKKVDILYICNYNNPTLTYISTKDLYTIIEKNKKCDFIIDETVLTFDVDYDKKTMMKYVNKLNNLYILVSLSKIFGICGLRIGLTVCSGDKSEQLIHKQVPFSINSIGYLFINKFLGEFNNLNYSRKKIKNNFKFLIQKLDNNLSEIINDILYNNSSFLLIEIKKEINYDDLIEFLYKNNIKIFAVNKYYNNLDNNYIRISAGKKKEFKKLIRVLMKYREVK